MTTPKIGILLMTFGSAVTSNDVIPYLRSVYRGREPSPETIAEFERRYDLVGRSPLVDITQAQGDALEEWYRAKGDSSTVVRIGMLHSLPTIGDGVGALVDADCTEVYGLILAPHFSDIIMSGYVSAFEDAMAVSAPDLPHHLIRSWWELPEFISLLATATTGKIDDISTAEGKRPPVIFTAHSLPEAVAQKDPGYIKALTTTATAVAKAARLDDGEWQFAYQSAGHSPEPWLTPDFKDIVGPLAKAGHRSVLVVPLQFLADHLEILYDIDIAGGEEATSSGITMHRIDLPNTAPAFIETLAAVVATAHPVAIG